MKDSAGAAKSGRSSGMAGGKREQVKAAQQALKDKGHDPGPVDGVMGPKTQAALKDFQSKEGLTSSGQLDAETMSKLGVEAKAGASADTTTSSPSASPGASSGSSSPSASPGASGSTSAPGGTGTDSKSGSTGGASSPGGSSSGAPAGSGGSSTGSSGTK
jgi:peptidoglycan hydrolase-like protein with peptidoglycan-binding domain